MFKKVVEGYVVENVDDAERDADGNVKVDVDGQFLAQHGGSIVASLFGALANTLSEASQTAAAKMADPAKTADGPQDEDGETSPEPGASDLAKVPTDQKPSDDGLKDKRPSQVKFNVDVAGMFGQLLAAAQARQGKAHTARGAADEDAVEQDDTSEDVSPEPDAE